MQAHQSLPLCISSDALHHAFMHFMHTEGCTAFLFCCKYVQTEMIEKAKIACALLKSETMRRHAQFHDYETSPQNEKQLVH